MAEFALIDSPSLLPTEKNIYWKKYLAQCKIFTERKCFSTFGYYGMRISYTSLIKDTVKALEESPSETHRITSIFYSALENLLKDTGAEAVLLSIKEEIPPVPKNLARTSRIFSETDANKIKRVITDNHFLTYLKNLFNQNTSQWEDTSTKTLVIEKDLGGINEKYFPDTLKIKNISSSPIELGRSFFGTIFFFSFQDKLNFDKHILEAIETATTVIALLLSRIKANANLKLLESAIDASLSTNPALLSTQTLNDVLASLLNTALKLAPADYAHIFLYDGTDKKELVFGAAFGPHGKMRQPYSKPRKDGLTYTVAKTGIPVVVPDIRTHELFKNAPPEWNGSIISLPLKIGERVVGVMNISRTKPHSFSDKELRIWKLFSNHAAVSIENARLIEAEREKNKQLNALRSALAAINSSLNLSEVFNSILNEIRRVIHYDSASIMLLHGDRVHVIAGKNLPDNKNAIGKSYKISELERTMIRTKRPTILKDARENPYFKGWGNTTYVRGWMGVPLISDNEIIGFITIDNKKPDTYSQQDAELAMSFAHHAAIAVRNAMLHESLEEKIKALEEYQSRLVQTEKLAAIGKLIAGVAHELNNPLTSIMGITEILIEETEDGDTSKLLRQLLRETERTARIVKNLLDFARQQKTQKEIVNINEILGNTLQSLKSELQSSNISIVKNLSKNLPKAYADPYKLQQVFTNIIINAKQALEEKQEGRIITIHTKFAKPLYRDIDSIKRGFLSRERVIRVSIQDNGPGIPTDILPRIFDPFFTTKQTGKGTGLGLSVCHGIVTEHSGHIWAESTPTTGTTFFVELPPAPKADTLKHMPPSSGKPQPPTITPNPSREKETGRKRKILIAEDEENIRKILSRYLSRFEYTVKGVPNGKDAIDSLLNEDFDIIICDLKMPDVDGYRLFEVINGIKPSLANKFIVITGDTVNQKAKNFLEKHHLPFLPKPFNMEDILQLVRSLS